MIQNWRNYFVVFQGKNSFNSTAIKRIFNAEKEQKNETKYISYANQGLKIYFFVPLGTKYW
jgi:hypothetical protein